MFICLCPCPEVTEQLATERFENFSFSLEPDFDNNSSSESFEFLFFVLSSSDVISTMLQELDLSHCSLPVEVCGRLLSAFGKCRKLRVLWLPGNALTGCLQYFLADPNLKLPFLEELFLSYTINQWDLLHLTQLIRTEKMPQLRELDLGANNLNTVEEPLGELVQALIHHHQRELKLNLYFNNLSNECKERVKVLCKNTSIALEL